MSRREKEHFASQTRGRGQNLVVRASGGAAQCPGLGLESCPVSAFLAGLHLHRAISGSGGGGGGGRRSSSSGSCGSPSSSSNSNGSSSSISGRGGGKR